uniref:PWWP domain-containing protein n=1 Tax=Knipowitschia caucasica TaxID=637954 RepID=A0AAV2LNI0_KNICA
MRGPGEQRSIITDQPPLAALGTIHSLQWTGPMDLWIRALSQQCASVWIMEPCGGGTHSLSTRSPQPRHLTDSRTTTNLLLSTADFTDMPSPGEKVQNAKISEPEEKACRPRRGQKSREQAVPRKRTSSPIESKDGTSSNGHLTEQTRRVRPRLHFDISSSDELPSSDLSIELSVHEEPGPHLSFQEDEESQEEEDEDFPSFLLVDTKSSSITPGSFVWYKFRNYPFWPALVKRVYHKIKRASILVVDEKLIQQKKGFIVSLRTLKPYECEEFNELICKAREKYDLSIQWCVDLIEDYIMRKGIGSFSGSFTEYYTHNISYPVRRKYEAISRQLNFATELEMEQSFTSVDLDDSFNEQQDEDPKQSRRLLPDRTRAAHNRANEKLVNFIVKQRVVEQDLMEVMCGQQQSKWLCSFLSARRKRRHIVKVYLEDDEQLDQVYCYLNKLRSTAAQMDSCLGSVKSADPVPFILDVLLPEAIIHAIARQDGLSMKKAEEKYLKGRCLSNRERQEFDATQCTMHDLTAQLTSSLIPFPGVTLNALGEDEITLDSVLQGKFTVGRSGLAWLSCGPHLETVHTATGERLSAYSFSGGGEHPPCILAAKDFSWLKRSGLLIGLEEAEGSVLCLYDLGLSRVVKAVVIPGRITYIEPLVSYGGASASTQHLHQSLRWFFGIAAVGTDLGHVLLVDLCLDDLSCSQSELEASDLQVVTKSPAEIPKLREVSCREGRHLCVQLNGATGVGASALQYISRTNQLAVGFSDGYMHLWNMKALKKEYHSQLEGGKVPVNAFTFQEPENDPRNCCYLWAVQSSQDLEGDMVSLHLLQLAFSERKCSGSGKILYEGLEYCEERYSQELSGTAFPLRAQATNTRLLNCQTIEKFRPHLDRDDSMNEISSPDTSVSIFIWQVKAYGQGTPATFIGVFDINRWYHAQMPDSLRAGESLQNCPYLAVWSLDAVMQAVSPHMLLDVLVNERSLSRGLPHTCPPPEQYFNPTTYNFDATCLLNTGIVHLTCSGYQKEALGFLKKAAPCSSDVIASIYSRCLMSGLLSSRLTDTQASSLSQEEQLDAILCTAVETSSLGLITGCIKQWTAEEQPGSALNLRYILDWAWSKVVQTKEELDGICAPLFDSSSNFTDPQTLQLLQHCQRLLTNLSTIFNCLLCEAHELTQKGLVGLMNKNMVSGLISKYAQVVLWFCRTGLLPEGSVEDALQISRPFYSHSIISNYYSIRREELKRLAKGKWCADCLMIDGLVDQCGERLLKLWKRDEEGTGQYPPPTLHALLDIYLLDNIDEATKHAIVIYLLLDVMYAFSNKDGASVESFPTAFAIPIGLVKLIQGLWLLDHHDHQSAFELLLHPAASQCPFVWQHERVLQALMCQGQHAEALRYFHVTKPIMVSTSQAKLCLLVLLHNRCLIEAWSLARQHSNHLNISELLGFLFETCQELGLIKELLKLPLGLSEQESLEKFLQGTGGLQNRELLMVHYLQQANYIPALQLNHSLKMNLVNERDPKLKEQSNIRNAILDQYGKVLPRVQRQLALERAKPYQRPLTIHKEVSRPKPLSTISKRSASENVISRAGFINNLLTKIEEVWIGRDSPQSSPIKSPKTMAQKCPSPKLSSTLPEPFLGTPITMSAKRKSRLMKLVVQPSQMPQVLLSPPRPPTSWVSPKRVSNAPELSLLQTPQVVKRARALAASGPVFAAFTPQSILRTSLRPTPVATPSASPRRSVTPPPRKENRITFIEAAVSPEMEKSIPWTNGEASDDEIRLLTRGALLSKATRKSWSSQAEDEEVERQEEEDVHEKPLSDEMTGGSVSPHQSVSNPPSEHYDTEETRTSGAQLVLSFETSHTSVRSADTTLEFYDAPLAEESEDDKYVDRDNGIVSSETPEEDASKPQTQVHSEEMFEEALPLDKSEGVLGDHDDVEFEGIPETNWDQEATNEALINANSEQDTSNGGNDLIGASVSQPVDVCEQSFIPESAEDPEALKPSENLEPTNRTEQELEQSADLTEFVQKHLFGDDLSLTRSGIHSVSLAQTSINSDFVDQEAEEEQTASSKAPVFPSRKSTTSITSSEPTGTDSHSVFSINDSEDLSRPVSEEDCEDEEEDEEEEEEEEEEDGEDDEEEDSGSEVEIIEEIQGRPPPALSSEYIVQEQSHCLPNLLEQDAEAFSSEIKSAEEDGIGEVVMVHLGTDEQDMDQDEEVAQAASYLELKPSSTLLVPLELVEEQDISAEQVPNDIFQTDVSNDHKTESQSSFSLTLDLEEDGDKEPETNIMNNPLSTQVLLTEIKEMEEPVAFVEVKPLVNDVLDAKIEEPVACVEVTPPVDEVLEAEIKEMEEPVAPVEHHQDFVSRQNTEFTEELFNKQQKDSHPARTTRQSNRNTLSVYPQSVKRRAAKGQDQSEPEPKRDVDSLHKTKKKLWDQPEQEQPLLDPPLEVDSETPVADALIKRLHDEKQKLEVTRSTRSSKKSVTLPEAPLVNCALFDTDDNSSQGESSFIYSPSRSRTRAKAVESPSRTGPVTRSRKVSSVDLEVVMAEDNPVEEPSVPNTRKTSKRTTKPKAALEPTLIAEVDLLSPLPSPADPVRRAQKRTKEVDGPTSTMNFRRKRIMGTVLTKPVTRRKKL